MSFLSTLNDEQLALLGCVGALFVSGTLMSLSHYIGRARGYAAQSPGATGLTPQPVAMREAGSPQIERSRRNAA